MMMSLNESLYQAVPGIGIVIGGARDGARRVPRGARARRWGSAGGGDHWVAAPERVARPGAAARDRRDGRAGTDALLADAHALACARLCAAPASTSARTRRGCSSPTASRMACARSIRSGRSRSSDGGCDPAAPFRRRSSTEVVDVVKRQLRNRAGPRGRRGAGVCDRRDPAGRERPVARRGDRPGVRHRGRRPLR